MGLDYRLVPGLRRTFTKVILLVHFLVLISLVTACKQRSTSSYTVPKTIDDGWSVSTPADEGFDGKELASVIENSPVQNPKLDAIVISRNGQLVVDQYFNGFDASRLHKVWSITKMISGTLIGIAADRSLISIDDSISRYLGSYMDGKDSSVYTITIEHLVTMTSGFEWVELGGTNSAGFQLPLSEDWIRFTLNQPHTNTPGEVFTYSSGNSMLLAPIIKTATSEQAHEFAVASLFEPLSITKYEWDKQSEFWSKTQSGEFPGAMQKPDLTYQKEFAGFTNTGTGLRMRPRDLCKFGQLYLDKGVWDDKQIVSPNWVGESMREHFNNEGYGYHWKLMTFDDKACYYATGFGLQRIYVFPTIDLVVVFTQQHYRSMPEGLKLTHQLLSKILKTIEE